MIDWFCHLPTFEDEAEVEGRHERKKKKEKRGLFYLIMKYTKSIKDKKSKNHEIL